MTTLQVVADAVKIRERTKTAAYKFGVLSAYHRLRNNSNLTTVMFHRVLPKHSEALRTSDPLYTLPTDVFRDCLLFLRHHYNIISLTQLTTAQKTGERLPDCPLLLTFDDGWADTLDHAAPELNKMGLPGVCFVASDPLDDPEIDWWQDTFNSLWRHGQISEVHIREAWQTLRRPPIPNEQAPGVGPFLRCLAMLQEIPPTTRKALLGRHGATVPPGAERQMLRPESLRDLLESGVAIGAHGATHLPLTLCRNVEDELTRSRRRLSQILGGESQGAVTAMSFPHGRFTDDMVRTAWNAGYDSLFTSRQVLDRVKTGAPSATLFGRIEISLSGVTDTSARFRPELMAMLMFSRPILTRPGGPRMQH